MDFGDGSVVNTTNTSVNHTYTQSGTFTVRLIITDLNGCNDTVTKTNYIRINGPVANFTANNTNGCTGLTTYFLDASATDGIHPITNWLFFFGDGASGNYNAFPVTHTYNATGTFSVKMVATDASGCKDSISYPNLIRTTDPNPDFTASTLQSCPGAIIQFNNTTTPPGFTSFWEFGDYNTSTQNNPSHAYTQNGIYTVKLRITDNNGCTDSVTKQNYILINSPRAQFTPSDTPSACIPFEVQFTNQSVYYQSLLWSFGPGEPTSTLTNPVHYFSRPGIYPVTLRVTSAGGCIDSVTRNIVLYDTAGTGFQYNPLGGCSPLQVQFQSTSAFPVVNYLWDFGDGNVRNTNSNSLTNTYTNFGAFTPVLILEDPAGCLIPLQGPDTIHVIGAKAKFVADTTLHCDRGSVQFTDFSAFNDAIISYQWNFGDGNTSSLQNPTHYYAQPGLYTVQLIIQT